MATCVLRRDSLEMGLQMVRSFPWIDYVCLGEGDRAFPQFMQSVTREPFSINVPGIAGREQSNSTAPERIQDLDSIPYPDYTDYFDRLNASPMKPEVKVDLPIETSRGCWWGAKQHCTFCGLNGETMAFRSKSLQRVFAELVALSQTYGIKSIECVDNILNMRYIPTLFEQLSESDLNLELFYEVKANLRYEQLAVLRGGGVRAIQPGIESFSNQVLRLMRKGCTGLQNIQLLRWCEELNIQVGWNLLTGFPNESAAEYDRMERLLPLLTHLQPPASCCPVRLDRFSPFFTNASEFGLVRVRPSPAYYYVFPFCSTELEKLAYFFNFDYADGRRPTEYMTGVAREVQRWLDAKKPSRDSPQLDATWVEDELIITDSRASGGGISRRLSGLGAEVYSYCDSIQSSSGLRRRFAGQVDALFGVLARLCDSRLMITDEDHYLSLAIFRNRVDHLRYKEEHAGTPKQEIEAPEPLLRMV